MGLRGRNNLTECRIFFVTTTVVNFLNVFLDEHVCQLLIDNIKHYQEKYQFIVLAYVIMPSHFHWVVEVNPKLGTISDVMRDIKKYSAWDIMEYLAVLRPALSPRFVEASKRFPAKQKRKFWMERFDDEVIRNERMFWAKLIYVHNNPVKAGLVSRPEEYKYSSARNYLYGDNSVLDVDVSFAGIQIP